MANARWYVVNVYAGSEKKVAESIKEQAEQKKLTEQVIDVLVPMEKTVEIKRGEKINTEKNFFPGYVLVHMVLSDESWHLISNVPKVTGFLGGKGKPSPVSKSEVDRIVSYMEEQKDSPVYACNFVVGEEVVVVDGPFSSFNGAIEEIDEEKNRLKVSVMIFGRATPVELEFSQVKKI